MRRSVVEQQRRELVRRLAPYLLLLLLFFTGAFFAFAFWRVEQSLEAAQRDKQRLEQEVTSVQRTLQQLRQSMEAVEPDRAAALLPDTPEETNVLRMFDRLAKEAGVTLEAIDHVSDIAPQDVWIGDKRPALSDRVKAIRWTVSLTGQSGAIEAFIHAVEKQDRLFVVDRLQFDSAVASLLTESDALSHASVDLISFSYE